MILRKDGSVRFISHSQNSIKIKRKPYPIPKIQDLRGVQYSTSLDLNMSYYHIELGLQSKRLSTIMLPWDKYEYQRFLLELSNSPDIFLEKMLGLMQDLENIRTYIDNLLLII